MIIIVAGLALMAVYANVQKARRGTIEKVTIIPVSASPSASPAPAD
jgi:ribosomal protein S8E